MWTIYKIQNSEKIFFTDEALPENVEKSFSIERMPPYPVQDGYITELRADFEKSEAWYVLIPSFEQLKKSKIEKLIEYDSSDSVNDFSIQGIHLWLDLPKRTGLKLRFEAEQAQGQEDTVLWHNGMQFPLKIQDALMMLFAIEVYASACYDNTQRHAAAISALDEKEELEAYDFTTGYPEKLEF